MGEAKNKKRRFLADHPHCCFCGGAERSTTVDHVPARSFFLGRAAPETFEFPACAHCQEATRLDELAFSMFVRINDPDPANYSTEEMRKIYKGIGNNLPHLLPSADLSIGDKRRALRDKGLTVPIGKTVSDVPMVRVPAAIDNHVMRYSRKLAAALYYREKGRSIGRDFLIWTIWGAATDQRRMKAFVEFAKMSPFQTIARRNNLDFGNRFGYRCDKTDDNELFMAIAQFGKGVVVAMLIADNEAASEIREDGWIRASAMFG